MELEKINTSAGKGRLSGHIAMLMAAILWGAMSPIAKHVMLSGAIPPLALSAIRIVGGAVVFWIAGAILPERMTGDNQRIKISDIGIIIIMSVLIVSANQGLYIVGIGFTTPFEATVMTTLTPVFTMLLAAAFISMPMTIMKVSGVALGLGGALLLALSSRTDGEIARNPMLGNLMCLGAQLCAAIYFTLFRKIIARYHPFVLLKWLFLAGTVTWVPFTWPSLSAIRLDLIDFSVAAGVIFIVLFPTFLSYLFMVYAQQRLKPTSVAMYNYVQPLTAAAIAAFMGLAVFGWTNILASTMIFAGVALVAFSPGRALPDKT